METQVVTVDSLGGDFDIGGMQAGKIQMNPDGVRDGVVSVLLRYQA